MSAQKEIHLGITLNGITTDEFAIIQQTYEQNPPIDFSGNLLFGKNGEARIIGVYYQLTMRQNDTLLLKLSAGCIFEIDAIGWSSLLKDEATGGIKIPASVALHLASVTVATARGILHEKTVGTHYNTVVLPLIDLTKDVSADIIIENQ